MAKINLKNYICSVPFSELEIHNPRKTLCCSSWLTKWLPEKLTPKEAWNSDDANKIRTSVLDGSFKYCDSGECPFLAKAIKTGADDRVVFHKDKIPLKVRSQIDKFLSGKEINPYTLQFSFDSTCNLKCPSCRNELIVEGSIGIKRVKGVIENLQKEFGSTTKRLYITGTGDPFISIGFREFLKNFDKAQWPELDRIHLHTNATKWNRKMWDSMKTIHPYVTTCEISIDAATKYTYENKTRMGGNWDELIENLNFIATISTLKTIKTSFVVQANNYTEMKLFNELMYSIFGKKTNVYFGKILNWGTFTDEEFLKHQIWNPLHPEYSEFVMEVNNTLPANNAWSNLQEFISTHKTIL